MEFGSGVGAGKGSPALGRHPVRWAGNQSEAPLPPRGENSSRRFCGFCPTRKCCARNEPAAH